MDRKMGGRINFWEMGTTSLVDPQELTPKPARKKAENKMQFTW